MRSGVIIAVVVAVLLFAVGGCLVGNYNRLVTSKEAVGQRWAQVDNQLKRRNDLIGSLVETVKGTAIQEQEVFGMIANARAQMAGGARPTQPFAPAKGAPCATPTQVQAAQNMDTALGRLLVVVENYCDLRSSEAF